MVRTTITPDHANIEVSIPQSYIGKKLEVMVYAVDEVENGKTEENNDIKAARLVEPKKPSDFKGIIPSDMVEEFQNYVKKSREEWQ